MKEIKMNKVLETYILDHNTIYVTKYGKISDNDSLKEENYKLTNAILYVTQDGLKILADLQVLWNVGKEELLITKNSHWYNLEEDFEKEINMFLFKNKRKDSPETKLLTYISTLSKIKETLFEKPAPKSDLEILMLYSNMKHKVLRTLFKKEINKTVEKNLLNLFDFFDSVYLPISEGRRIHSILKDIHENLKSFEDRNDALANKYIEMKYKEINKRRVEI